MNNLFGGHRLFGMSIVMGVALASTAFALAVRARRAEKPANGRHSLPESALDPRTPCAVISAAVASTLLERPVTLAEAKRNIQSDPLGRSSMAELIDGLRSLGFFAVELRMNADAVERSPLPMILLVNESHFVTAAPRGAHMVVVLDPPREAALHGLDDIGWAGETVLVAPDEAQLAAAMELVGVTEIDPELSMATRVAP